MANVSSSNGLEKRPKLRFPGFDEPWKSKPFSSLYKYVNEKNDGSFSVGSIISVANMYFKPDARITDMEYLKTYNIFKLGDIAFEGNKSKDFSFGRFVENTIGDGIVSHVFVVFRPINNFHNFDYWKYAINNENVMGRILARCTKKTTMMTNLVTTDFLTQKIYCPSLEEQAHIASFLSLIDQRIRKQKELLNALKKYKRGLSDELFGENGRTEEWTTVPFSEAFELLQNNTFSRDEMSTENGIAYNIHYGDILIKYGTVVNLSTSDVPYIHSDGGLLKFSKHSYLRDGDIVIADTAEDYTVGKAVEIAGVADAKILSGLHTIPCRPKISFAPMYLGYFINSKRFRTQMLPLVQGTKVSSISKSEILKTAVVFPSYEVQSRIASMLYALDQKIDICNIYAQELVRIKEALLQQLFI